MKKPIFRLIATCLALCVLLSGCGVVEYFERLAGLMGYGSIHFDDMEYTRPDTDAIEAAQEECVRLSEDPDEDVDALITKIEDYFWLYTGFCTNYYLAYIHYSIDMSDTYWETEYNYCADRSAAVDAGRDRLMYALADSAHREKLESEDLFGKDYFDAYNGESTWSDAFTALMDQDAALQSEYYRISGEAMEAEYYSDAYFEKYGPQLAELFVQMIRLRQQIAAEAGYDDYLCFAYDFYHHRDYTPADAAGYMETICTELTPLYRDLIDSGIWSQGYLSCSPAQTYGYVERMAAAMGGTINDAFHLMDEAELYHISYGENKYAGSFEIYLLDYMEPFVFVSPSGTAQDKLTFAHEFGHFCNDYASSGSMASVDVAEFFSQGMEYLSLCYVDNTAQLQELKMADSLCVYVEQAAYASFEHQVYSLTGDALTVENVQALYEQTCTRFGFDSMDYWDSRDYVTIGHFFTSPLYIISYVVSNDAAMQLYQMEQTEDGSGLACYTDNLTTGEAYFLAFLKDAGLESPFADGRIAAVKKTFQTVLG